MPGRWGGGRCADPTCANWPARRVDHWTALLRARAIENQAFVIGVNRTGSDPNESYVSSSEVFAPDGRSLGNGIVDIDPDEATALRTSFPMLDDTRDDY